MVANCGFETGDFSGWTQGGNTASTFVPTAGFAGYDPNSGVLQFAFRDDPNYLALDDVVVVPLVTTPEPASIVLLGSLIGLAGFGLRRRVVMKTMN